MIWTVMERSAPPDVAGVAQLRVFGDASCGYIVNVYKTLSPEGANTSIDSCCLSVSTIAG
jgi:hypothetical protein